MPFRIEKPLPGELEGDIDPEDYGFDVIKEEPLTKEEEAKRIGVLYAQAKKRTGVVIPKLERYLGVLVVQPEVDEDTPSGDETTSGED
jgi:hypothetical protein